MLTYFDTLHSNVVDDADDASGASHRQERVTGAGVIRPSTGVEVLICLCSR